MDNFTSKLISYKNLFEPYFEQYFRDLQSNYTFPNQSNYPNYCLDLIRDLSLRGGKRQRVAFLYETVGLFGTKIEHYLLDCAVSIELLQTHLLIHDDTVDNSPTRRNGPTTYYQLKEYTHNNNKAALGLSIMTGDIAAYLAIDCLLNKDILPDILQKIIKIQVQAGLDTFEGQIYDIERDIVDILPEKNLFDLADLKAVRSSTYAPMAIGLVAANADTQTNIHRIQRYALNVGIAGQLQDDYLGIFGDPTVTGKSAISDITEGKRTLMINVVLSRCSSAEKKTIFDTLGNESASIESVDHIKELIKKYDADNYLKDTSHKFAQKAIDEAESWTELGNEAKGFFIEAANWFINRKL